MWEFTMDRARLEAKERGFMVKNSPLTITEKGLTALIPIMPAVREFCENNPGIVKLQEDDLELILARTFRHRLSEEVCEPNGIYMGACLVMLIEALRLENIIPARVKPLADSAIH
jgi:hypothetical protein